MSNLGRFLKEEEIKKLLGEENEEEKDYSSLVNSILDLVLHSRLGSDPLSVPGENSSAGSLSVLVPAMLATVAGAGIVISVPVALMIIDLCTDLADTYDNWIDDESLNPDSPLYDFQSNIKKFNIIVGDIWNYNNPDFVIEKKGDSYNLSDIFTRRENGKLWNKCFGNALNFGLSEENRFVEENGDETFNFSKIIAFKDLSNKVRYLSDVLPKVLSMDTWHIVDRSDFD